jgi:hypothetical protein
MCQSEYSCLVLVTVLILICIPLQYINNQKYEWCGHRQCIISLYRLTDEIFDSRHLTPSYTVLGKRKSLPSSTQILNLAEFTALLKNPCCIVSTLTRGT